MLDLISFSNTWGNSYTKFVIQGYKFRFIYGKSDLYWNIVSFYLWRIGPVLKYCNVLKYYEQDIMTPKIDTK